MSKEEITRLRGISEVVHFTTHLGLTGILHQRQVQSQNLLRANDTLQFILRINTPKNFDPAWKDYVNLSISRINLPLLGSSQRWHPDANWRILVFDPMVLTHDNVHFVTTNNAYWQHLERGTGPDDFERLFSPRVASIYGQIIDRPVDHPPHWTTDVKAEVLYPNSLSTEYLRRIIVPTELDAESVAGQLSSVQHSPVPIDIEPQQFYQH